MRKQYFAYDGDTPVPITKTVVRDFIKRLRQDARDMEDALRQDDLDQLRDFAEDASGTAGYLQGVASATVENASD